MFRKFSTWRRSTRKRKAKKSQDEDESTDGQAGFHVELFKEDFSGNCKSVTYYLSHVERHLNPKLFIKKKPKHKHARGLIQLKVLLISLSRDLENNSMGLWFNELVCDQQRGHEMLLKLLVNLVEMPERLGKRVISRDGVEQELCAQCLRRISNNRLGLNCLSAYEHGYQVLLQSIDKGRQTTVKHVCAILVQYCKHSNNTHNKIISHLDCFKKKHGYESKFTVLLKHLMVRADDYSYTAWVLRLLTGVVHSATSLNLRTFYQQEVELEITVGKVIEGVPSTASSLHSAMRDWEENCINIPAITARLEESQGKAGLLQEECRVLRDKLAEREDATRKLAAQQQVLTSTADTAHDELSEMRSRLEAMAKDLIKEKVKVQRLETVRSSHPTQNITQFINPDPSPRSTPNKSKSHSKPPHPPTLETAQIIRRRVGSKTRKGSHDHDESRTKQRHVKQASIIERGGSSDSDYKRLSNRSSSGSEKYRNSDLIMGDIIPAIPLRNSLNINTYLTPVNQQSAPELPPKIKPVRPTSPPMHKPAPPQQNPHNMPQMPQGSPPPPPPPPKTSTMRNSRHASLSSICSYSDIPPAPTAPQAPTTAHMRTYAAPKPVMSNTPPPPPPPPPVPAVSSNSVQCPKKREAPYVAVSKPATPAPPKPPSAPGAPKPPGAPNPPGAPTAPGAPKALGAPGTMTLLKQPKVKLPLFHWNPLKAASSSYWAGLDVASALEKLDLTQFEEQFQIKNKPTMANVAKIIKRKVECLSLLDQNRARNAMIIQRRVAMKPLQVAKCVEQTDLGELPVWAVELLHGCVPSREETDKLLENGDKLPTFGEAEIFCYHLSQVSRYERKLGIMQFIGTFDEQFARLIAQVTSVKDASVVIKDSAKLRKILELILALGNYMNAGRKGLASGFKIQSLAKVSETHSGDYKQTLLHFIVAAVNNSMPELHGFTAEFGSLDEARKVSLKELVADVQEMKQNLDMVLDERDKQRDNFVIFSFYNRAQRKVKRLGEQTRQMLEKYDQVCKAFGESSKRIEPTDFFKYFSDFFLQFEKTGKELKSKENEKKPALLSREMSRNLVSEAAQRVAAIGR